MLERVMEEGGLVLGVSGMGDRLLLTRGKGRGGLEGELVVESPKLLVRHVSVTVEVTLARFNPAIPRYGSILVPVYHFTWLKN